jgi:LuxR family maltose regulon positive regulatory protein
MDFLPLWGKADDFVLAYVTLARIHLAQANKSDALGDVEKAIQLIQIRGVFSEARKAVEIAQVKLWLAQGDLQAATHWAASLLRRLGSDDPFRFENEVTHIAQARVLIAQNKPEEGIALLSHLEEIARSTGRMGRLLEILLLQASALWQRGECEHALLALTRCLELAAPEGYARLFLDEGKPMQSLLVQWLVHASDSPQRTYASHLLSQFETELHSSEVQEKDSRMGDLVEPLSQRELEVLHLIALGRTNQEIARQLIVAPGTVKAHTASIYRKLNVTNRTEAVARARQIGILP